MLQRVPVLMYPVKKEQRALRDYFGHLRWVSSCTSQGLEHWLPRSYDTSVASTVAKGRCMKQPALAGRLIVCR